MMRDKIIEREMRAVFKRWDQDMESLSSFGKRVGVAYHRLKYWKKYIVDDFAESPSTFLPVEVVADEAASEVLATHQYEIVLGSGHRVTVSDGFNANELRRLVAVLTTC